MKKNYGIYSYGINGFSLCYNKETKQIEENLLIMFYGKNKMYVFPKDKAYDLICAVVGDKNVNGSKFEHKDLELEQKFFDIDIVKALDMKLKGRALVMVTKFRNDVEYINGVQNELVGITGLNLDCKMLANSEKYLFKEGFADFSVNNYCEPPKECFEEHSCDA